MKTKKDFHKEAILVQGQNLDSVKLKSAIYSNDNKKTKAKVMIRDVARS